MTTRRGAFTLPILGLLATVAAAPPGPNDEFPVQVPGELSEGNWAGTGLAWGATTRNVDGTTFTFQGEYSAPLQLTVDDDEVEGFYDFDGDWTLDGVSADAELHGEYSGSGTGTITGNRTSLELDGTSSSEGQVRVKAAGNEFVRPANHPQSTDHFELEVTSSTCTETYLNWESAWNLRLEDVGWQPTFEGTIVLVLDVEELRAAVEKWLENTRSGIDLGQLDPLTRPPGLPGVVIAVEGVLRNVVEWAQTSPMNPWQETADLVYDAELVLNRLRNASPCDRYLVGAGVVEQFTTLVTDVVARGIDDLLFDQEQTFQALRAGFEDGSLEATGEFSDALLQLTNIALRTGVIGAGATDPDRAASIETLLRLQAERVLSAFVDVDNPFLIDNNKETRGVFAIGNMMGWIFNVRGVRWDPSDVISEYGDVTDFALPGADE